MKKILILAIACTTACLLHAQIPKSITLPKNTTINVNPSAPEIPCNNFAGTFVLGQKGDFTQSNDLTLDTIWLCSKDSIFINHNGDFNLSGDPVPATPPGVGYAFYTCPPTVTGPILQNITGSSLPVLPGDPCRLVNVGMPLDLLVTSGNANGDTWFFNSGFLQTTFNMGQPMLLHFAPITFDDATNNGYEPVVQGGPPGPCVNVNTAAQFEVVYLNPITAVGFTNPFLGNSCLGRFKLEGGYAEWDLTKKYNVDIYLASDPTVKAVINNAEQQIKHGVSLIFSVPVAGNYVINVEDGKSCGLRDTVVMGSCINTDNVSFILGNVQGAPGENICVPITTSNYSNIQGFSTSIQWDPNLLQLQPGTFITNINPDLSLDFDPTSPGNVETSLIGSGYLGLLYFGTSPGTINSSEVLMEICFKILTQQDSICTPISFFNQPSSVSVINSAGGSLAFEAVNGEVCVLYDTISTVVNIQLANCDGTTNVVVTATGGEAPYEFQWRREAMPLNPPGATSSVNGITAGVPFTIPNLLPGDYRLIVIPMNGFDPDSLNYDTVYFTVNAATLGAALDLSMLPSCNGDTDGTVTAIVFQGSTQVQAPYTGYTFTWAGTVPDIGMAVQNPVGFGAYTVTVTQIATGCTALAAGTLPNPPVLDKGVVTITPGTCTGVADGTISYDIQGGTPTPLGLYTIEVFYSPDPSDPNGVQVGNTSGGSWVNTALETGFYRLVITDSKGCTFTDEVFVPALRVVDMTELVSAYRAPNCNGGTDGRLGVTLTMTPAPPGGANFTFSWLPTGANQTGTPTTSTLDMIPAGTYFIQAVDANGCSDTITLELNEPPIFTASVINQTNPTCPNPAGGSITVSGLGGSGAPASFTYNWSDIGAGLPARSGLVAGTYTVIATDAKGCTASTTITLVLPPPPAITGITKVDVRCGPDGSLTVNAPTAATFAWTSSNGPLPNPTSAVLNNLVGGTYTVVVTDAFGCTNSQTATLLAVEPLVFSVTTLNAPTCNGYNDGSIALGVTGGNPGYNYSWNPTSVPPNSPINLALKAGVYSVTVTDTKMCTLVGEFTLTEPPVIQALVSEPTVSTGCFGSCDGIATVLVNYQTGSNFNFVWDNGSTDSMRLDLCTGLNTVTITETSAAQCFIIFEVNVTSPPQITADSIETSIKNVSCFGDDDGSINVAPKGGNGGPYSFVWQAPVTSTSSSIQNLMPGMYVATITDSQGCTTEYEATVGQPDPMFVSIDATATLLISCFGENDGRLGVITTGGNPANPGGVQYTYVWSDGLNQIGTTNPIDMLAAGSYMVTVTDSKNCTGTTMIPLPDPSRVLGDYKLGTPLQCYGDETTIAIDNIVGGQGAPYSYTIDFGVPLDPTFTSNITGGEHYITYIDQKNCETTDTINVPEPPQIIVTFDEVQIDKVLNDYQLGDSLTLTPLITGAVVSSFEWMPANFLVNPDTLQPSLYTFESGNLMLTVFDDKGCMGKGTLRVEVDPNRNVYLPNVFIPGNRFGTNDYFTPFVGVGVQNINYMRVYDRWGELMYGRDNFLPSDLELTSGWDGRFKGKFVEPGVYVYAIEVVFLDKKVLLYRGDVTVVR
jgi:hypothetical protein